MGLLDRQPVVGLASLAIVLWSSVALGGIDIPWSTTFDCPEWTQPSMPLVCDGIEKKGSWAAQPGNHYEEIISAANFPGGGGGRGKRYWIGNTTNNNSGGIKITFNSKPNRLWIRWYQRWQAGFTSNWGTFKNLWFEKTGGDRMVFHTGCAGSPNHADGVDFNPPDKSTCVRNVAYGHDFYPSGVSDGSWQCFEVHLDIPNTTWKVWINGKLVVDRTDVDFAGAQSIDYILAPVNTKEVNNPNPPMYVDMDDFVINTTGYIGPIPGWSPKPSDGSTGDGSLVGLDRGPKLVDGAPLISEAGAGDLAARPDVQGAQPTADGCGCSVNAHPRGDFGLGLLVAVLAAVVRGRYRLRGCTRG